MRSSWSMANTASPHLAKSYETWKLLRRLREAGGFELDGDSLHIAHVVGVALHGCQPQLTARPDVMQSLQDSAQVLMHHLANGYDVYGVNTGFGGSADSRTSEVIKLQAALMQLTQAGILSQCTGGSAPEQAMPAAWVRATIAVRCNSTLRGHSAVSLPILQALVHLLEHGITPIVPLRGSVSASGDLMSLSYIAGAIEGNPDILVEDGKGRVVPAPEALAGAGLRPVALGPKEGLGLVNGTASSAALGALVISQAHKLAVLTQALTAMAVEASSRCILPPPRQALRGSIESFDPFLAQVRPHPGQVECARNIACFLRNSRLARDAAGPKDRRREELVQDRYSLRTAPQWLGPQLEDLLLADAQVSTELNSTSDNPLVDTCRGEMLYGGNFQAASVTSATEKTRLALQMMGRLLFAQLTEMADPGLSGGLPANLAADDPSLSFTIKGVEISMAAYMAELAFLAAPMSSHAQAAEMHNQSVNSMALASARMTMQAVDVLALMSACSLFAACQALDLRALHGAFKPRAAQAMAAVAERLLGDAIDDGEALRRALEAHVSSSWDRTGRLDLRERCSRLADDALPLMVDGAGAGQSAAALGEWKRQSGEAVFAVWTAAFAAFCAAPHTAELLGDGSRVLYRFVREELGVPFHRGLVEQPSTASAELDGRAKRTVGGWISRVHDAVRDDSLLYSRLMMFVAKGVAATGTANVT